MVMSPGASFTEPELCGLIAQTEITRDQFLGESVSLLPLFLTTDSCLPSRSSRPYGA